MSCSGRLSLYLLRSLSLYPHLRGRIDRFVFTQVISHLLLVLLLPVYVNLVKELFLVAYFQPVRTTVFPKASAKVLLFPELAKFFREYFQKIMHFLGLDDGNQGKMDIIGGYEQGIAEMRGLEGGRAELGSQRSPNGENEK